VYRPSRFTSLVCALLACAVLACACGNSRGSTASTAVAEISKRDRSRPTEPEAPREAPVVFELELEDAEDGRHGAFAAATAPVAVELAAPRPARERRRRALRRAPCPSVAGHGARSPPA